MSRWGKAFNIAGFIIGIAPKVIRIFKPKKEKLAERLETAGEVIEVFTPKKEIVMKELLKSNTVRTALLTMILAGVSEFTQWSISLEEALALVAAISIFLRNGVKKVEK